MLSVLNPPAIDPRQPAVCWPGGQTTWTQLFQLAGDLERRHEALRAQRVGIQMRATGLGLAQLAALERLRSDAFLLADELAKADADELARRFRLRAIIDGESVRMHANAAAGSAQSTVTILTSGTSGIPKAVRHTWAGLARPVRIANEFRGTRCLLCYRPNLYAGLQVILQSLANGGTLLVAPPRATATDVARLGLENAVEFVSATPSYWRWLLTFADQSLLRRWRLRQITLGGEVVEQRILDQLADFFPAARLVHIYATTELGRCFSVTDGRAGFPARYLDQVSSDGIEMKLVNGELLVRSANRMQGYDALADQPSTSDGWFHSGDLVERVGERCLFVGRRSDLINVGGNKVNPLVVERLVQSVDGVRDARIFGKASSLVGQLVACEILVADGHNPAQVIEAVDRACAAQLASHERPRIVRAVPQIQLSEAGKKARMCKP